MWWLMKEPVFLVMLPVSLALNLVFLLVPTPGWLIVGVIVFSIGASMTQVFHAALHRQDIGFGFRAMRRLGLLMSVPAHQLHHDTLQRDFATNCGWSNPVVNRLFVLLRARGLLDDAGLVPQS